MSVLGIVFSVAALLVALYGANSLLLLVLYLRHRSPARARLDPGQATAACRRPSPPAVPEEWPMVTVQLPLYNELFVVKRLIDAIAHLDYPRQGLHIQVLDDSTDETTRLARARVARHRARGLDIELIHRQDRRDFKAGALAQGFAAARGEFIAIFDADFVPPPNFLKRTIPHLLAEPGAAFVQARWGYLNADYSALTRAQTIALDGHFVVEHLARSHSGLLMNFNGTAGVWRGAAIEAAGGWQGGTLTEDLDLSFRAQLAGWRALYLPEVVAPAELPPQVGAFRRQQARWAAGAAQCLFKLAGALVRGRFTPHPNPLPPGERELDPYPRPFPSGERELDPPPELLSGGAKGRLPWAARLEGLLHLSLWVAHPMSLVLLLLAPLVVLGRIPLTFGVTLFGLMALGPIVAYTLSQQYLYPDWKQRMLYMPVLALLGTGLALSNTIAIAQGLLKPGQPFRRTPKFRLEQRGDRWQGSRYALRFQWITLGELALAGYAAAAIALAISRGHYLSLLFLLVYAAGYGLVGIHGLRDAWLGRRTQPRAGRSPAMVDSNAD